MLANTCCSESVVAMLIYLPLTVNVPAVTGAENPAAPTVTLFGSPPGTRILLMPLVPLSTAAVARWEMLKLKVPVKPPALALAEATEALEDSAERAS